MKNRGKQIYNQVGIQIKINENTQRKDRQCTYNITLRPVLVTTVAVKSE